jgi:hypothetical protein
LLSAAISDLTEIAGAHADFENRKSTEVVAKLVARGNHLRAALMGSVF